ncbi:hypothetical protein I4F81_001525 [Pyropia yezoensis]|uniref:Uncharacterized protein n=1 Tax=Pyropia yezoensis TaxID=2788 RepID=A0ACC3BMF2_PYRYE|nr:hypothetical protein I4F81_001525 [Neopyropia yezoensis]
MGSPCGLPHAVYLRWDAHGRSARWCLTVWSADGAFALRSRPYWWLVSLPLPLLFATPHVAFHGGPFSTRRPSKTEVLPFLARVKGQHGKLLARELTVRQRHVFFFLAKSPRSHQVHVLHLEEQAAQPQAKHHHGVHERVWQAPRRQRQVQQVQLAQAKEHPPHGQVNENGLEHHLVLHWPHLAGVAKVVTHHLGEPPVEEKARRRDEGHCHARRRERGCKEAEAHKYAHQQAGPLEVLLGGQRHRVARPFGDRKEGLFDHRPLVRAHLDLPLKAAAHALRQPVLKDLVLGDGQLHQLLLVLPILDGQPRHGRLHLFVRSVLTHTQHPVRVHRRPPANGARRRRGLLPKEAKEHPGGTRRGGGSASRGGGRPPVRQTARRDARGGAGGRQQRGAAKGVPVGTSAHRGGTGHKGHGGRHHQAGGGKGERGGRRELGGLLPRQTSLPEDAKI